MNKTIKKVIETLEILNLPVSFGDYKGNEPKHITFNVEEDETNSDLFYIEVNQHYLTHINSFSIRGLMENNGFEFNSSTDMYVDKKFGKKYRFIYKKVD